MRPQTFDMQFAPAVRSVQSLQRHALREPVGNIAVYFHRDFPMAPLGFHYPG